MHTDIRTTHTPSHVHVHKPPLYATPHKTNHTYLSTFKTHFPIIRMYSPCANILALHVLSVKTHFPIVHNYHKLHFSTSTDLLHIHYKAKLASLHSTCIHSTRCTTCPFTRHAWLCLLLMAGHCTSFRVTSKKNRKKERETLKM